VTSTVDRYLMLGLRLGTHVDGLVDAYYGPKELADSVAAEAPVNPGELAAEADSLALSVAAAPELDAQRRGWLGDQIRGMRTYAGVLAGESISYADEVERCYGVRPARGSVDVYSEAHEHLERLLPGDGDLRDRLEAWRTERRVDTDRLVPALTAVSGVLRAHTARIVDLPEGEELKIEAVSDEPWWAFNYYLGDLRSRVVINVDQPATATDIVKLAAHEIYPGHHTEHAVKEQRLIRDGGRLEESLQLVPTPQALISEGVAEAGLGVLLDEALAEELVAVLAGQEYDADLDQAMAIGKAQRPLGQIGVDAALMIHEEGGTEDDARAYVERWGLRTPARAAHAVRFVTDPTWRAYVITYSAGQDLCEAYIADDPLKFRKLLTEQVRVADLLATRT
jgi:hypothetical protein